MERYIHCLSAAGSDPSGGAGIQVDLKTFAALGCYGQAAVTALTVQNTAGVRRSEPVEASLVAEQMEAVMEDRLPDAVKIGITGTAPVARAVAGVLRRWRPPFVVLDPVLRSSSGLPLCDEAAVEAVLEELAPLCTLVTPNIPELIELSRRTGAAAGAAKACAEPETVAAETEDAIREMAAAMRGACGAAVLAKGGHRAGTATDLLLCGDGWHAYSAPRVDTPNTHGTGCTLSSAVAAYSARGLSLPEAVGEAKRYLTRAMEAGRAVTAGRGHGPLCHFFSPLPAIIETD